MKTIFVIISAFLLLTQNAYSCSCREVNVSDAVKKSKVIITGKVISVKEVSTYSTLSDNSKAYLDSLNQKKVTDFLNQEKMAVYKIIVTDTWKGKLTTNDTVTIFSHPNEATCGYIFQTDKDYIVYGNKTGLTPLPPWIDEDLNYSRLTAKKNAFWTNFCTRTTDKVKSETDKLKLLGLKDK